MSPLDRLRAGYPFAAGGCIHLPTADAQWLLEHIESLEKAVQAQAAVPPIEAPRVQNLHVGRPRPTLQLAASPPEDEPGGAA